MKTVLKTVFAVLTVFALVPLMTTCDMSMIGGGVPPTPGEGKGSSGSGIEDQIAELERNGHYLMLYHLPAGTTRELIRGVAVSDGTGNVAVPDPKTDILTVSDSVYVNAYIPLVTPGGAAFTRTGSFITAFTVQIDAVTRIAVTKAHNVMVPFTDGRGVLDIEFLVQNPDVIETVPDEATEREIENIIDSGGYIRFYNLPRNVTKNSFSNVSILVASGVIGRPTDYQAIAVRKNILDAEAFVPMADAHIGLRFAESGSYYVAFQVVADAVTRILVEPSYAALYEFTDGVGEVDAARVPAAPVKPPVVPHCLSIGGLPGITSGANVFDVFVYNSAGVVAKCPDYTKITLSPYGGKQTAVIPLVYDNNKAFNGKPFAESGNFIITFTIYPEAGQAISVTLENNFLASFTDGSALVDVSHIPAVPRNCLTITNLPANLQELDADKIFVWNQAGKVAKCQGYDLLEIRQEGTTSTIRIPLVYETDSARIFGETGPYYVSFDLNVDALTRIVITEAEKVLVSFQNGNGTLDASTLPQALPLPFFTIIGLPKNTVKGNFSEVFLYNAVGKIAKCADYQAIVVTKNGDYATAMIPLVYDGNGKEYFRDTGEFAVTFTITIDINTQIIKTRADNFVVPFADGSGELNLSSDYGYFSGGLVNPQDNAAPVLKSGTVFEMNGGYVKLSANTAVQPAEFSSTRVVYVYAVKSAGTLSFVYSDAAPAWNAAKKGFYLNDRRALFKLVYLRDVAVQYVGKTYIADEWPVFAHYEVNNVALSNIPSVYSLSGASNPAPQAYASSPGWYVVALRGAGGGGGGGLDGNGSADFYGGGGGTGGAFTELVYFDARSLTLFTGAGGSGGGGIDSTNSPGTGGGGGGSGTFIYTADGYFLCAGGGGGGGGTGFNGGGAGGGGGGSIGGGGGGGGNGPSLSSGASGGRGGGLGGGGGAGSRGGGGTGSAYGPAATHAGYNAGGAGGGSLGNSGGSGGAAYYTSYNMPDNWKNSGGANGSAGGGNRNGGGGGGGSGGNNRTATRGGGAGGGGGGSDGGGSGGQGGAGSITVYRVE
ncbi:MAG: hypothetical protein LBC31_02420 [Treponema sp.]|nr:hypothetical protein [Treponema sp.]